MKVVCFKTNEFDGIVKEFSNKGLDDFRNFIGCDLVQFVTIEMAKGKYYDIVCDEEGKCKDKWVGNFIIGNPPYLDVIAGDCVVSKSDKNGNSISLTDKDIEIITKYVQRGKAIWLNAIMRNM